MTFAQPMSSVSLKKVSKRYGSLYAVRDLDLEITEGEFFSLLGPSGCGKTTTLRMIAGFETPDSGQICFGERDVTFMKPNLRNTGMVFQNYALFPHMTVFENVAFGLRARRVEKQTIKARVTEALQMVELDGLEKRQVTELSGGQQQRVALARALVIEPGILLLDEPLSNLDAKLREETRYEIRKLQRRLGITTIYVTHDQEEALTVSDRIAVMNDGLCQQVGSPVDIYEKPATSFVAAFVGKANVLRGTIGSLLDGGVAIEVNPDFVIQLNYQADLETASGRERELAIRAEHIEVVREAIDEVNTFPANIERIEYSGALVEYEVLVARQRLRVRRLGEQHLSALADGDRVYIHIPPDRIRILQ